jgi:hypothetical protein
MQTLPAIPKSGKEFLKKMLDNYWWILTDAVLTVMVTNCQLHILLYFENRNITFSPGQKSRDFSPIVANSKRVRTQLTVSLICEHFQKGRGQNKIGSGCREWRTRHSYIIIYISKSVYKMHILQQHNKRK